MEEPVRCPVCGDEVDPDQRRLKSSVYFFCCEDCAPRVRHTFAEERDRRDGELTVGPDAA